MSCCCCEEVKPVLGFIALALEDWITETSPKLAVVDSDPEAGFYLNATYSFDLAVRLTLIHKAARKFALHADPELARELAEYRESFGDAEERQDYEALAERTEAALLRLIEEVGPAHRALLELVARDD